MHVVTLHACSSNVTCTVLLALAALDDLVLEFKPSHN